MSSAPETKVAAKNVNPTDVWIETDADGNQKPVVGICVMSRPVPGFRTSPDHLGDIEKDTKISFQHPSLLPALRSAVAKTPNRQRPKRKFRPRMSRAQRIQRRIYEFLRDGPIYEYMGDSREFHPQCHMFAWWIPLVERPINISTENEDAYVAALLVSGYDKPVVVFVRTARQRRSLIARVNACLGSRVVSRSPYGLVVKTANQHSILYVGHPDELLRDNNSLISINRLGENQWLIDAMLVVFRVGTIPGYDNVYCDCGVQVCRVAPKTLHSAILADRKVLSILPAHHQQTNIFYTFLPIVRVYGSVVSKI